MRELGVNKEISIELGVNKEIPRYWERLTGISKRKGPGKLLSRYKIYNKQY